MVRRPMLTRALALLIGLPALLLGWSTTTPAHAAEGPGAGPAEKTALLLTIDSMSPSYLPERGPITLTGRVTNRDDVAWLDVNVRPFISSTPLTTRAELAEAATLQADDYVGDRLDPIFDPIAELAPGATKEFSLTVPRTALTPKIGAGQPGVYWFGVHATGANAEGRDDLADGRARTFLPSVPATTRPPLRAALVMPLRRFLGREADGTLSDPEGWQRSLSPGGRLHEAVQFAAAAGPDELSWLVDPALPDAVQRLAAGNPERSLAPTLQPAEPGEEPTDEPTAEPEPEPEAEEVERTPEQQTAIDWLQDLESTLSEQELLTLPYGDLDLDGAVAHDPELLELAGTQVSAVLEEWGLTGTGALGSPSGYLDPDTIGAIDADVPVLVTDRAFAEEPPGVAELDGHKLVVTSSGAASGGPKPGDRFGSVALRQRILSEAALRVLETGRDPLVVMMPTGLTSEGADAFFAGLDVPWLDLTTLTEATKRKGRSVGEDDLVYPERQQAIELDPATFRAVDGLIDDGEALQNLLTLNDGIAGEVTEEALTGASFAARQSQLLTRAGLNRSRSWVQDRLASVEIGAPPGVTLSSASGEFVATITNRLQQPVTVSVVARSDRGIEITPPDAIELAPDSRTSVLLQARASEASVHNVNLLLTDADGTPIGSSDSLPIRSAQVSGVIWVIMGTGAGLLFGAIAVRLIRRFRGRHDPPAEATEVLTEPAEAT